MLTIIIIFNNNNNNCYYIYIYIYLYKYNNIFIKGNRDESNGARDVAADVEALYRAGEGKIGTDEMAIM